MWTTSAKGDRCQKSVPTAPALELAATRHGPSLGAPRTAKPSASRARAGNAAVPWTPTAGSAFPRSSHGTPVSTRSRTCSPRVRPGRRARRSRRSRPVRRRCRRGSAGPRRVRPPIRPRSAERRPTGARRRTRPRARPCRPTRADRGPGAPRRPPRADHRRPVARSPRTGCPGRTGSRHPAARPVPPRRHPQRHRHRARRRPKPRPPPKPPGRCRASRSRPARCAGPPPNGPRSTASP